MQILTTVLSRKLRAARGSCLDACRPLPLSPLPLSPLPFGLGQVKYKDTACTSAFDLCLRMDGRDGGAKCGAVVAADGTVSLAKAGRAWASAGLSDGLSRPRRGPVPPLWPKYAPPLRAQVWATLKRGATDAEASFLKLREEPSLESPRAAVASQLLPIPTASSSS